MIRWWDDPDTASAVLAAVDGSDLEQGVGTAALGLHALAKAALAPLVSATLVDRVDIAQVLADLPLEPVSKALAEATRSVMGIGSDRYGELLARDMADQAAAGTDHLLAVLTGQGMPMPLAVARAAEAVGLPARRTGTYAAVTKDLNLHPLVIADAADRALMGYAQALGRSEASSVEVSKSVQFQERAHPRNAAGEFALKGEERDPRLRRLARRKKRRAQAELVATTRHLEVPARGSSLADLSRALRPAQATKPAVEQVRTQQSLSALAAASREKPKEVKRLKEAEKPKRAAKPKPRVTGVVDMLAKPTGQTDSFQWHYLSADDTQYVLMEKDEVNRGELNWGALQAKNGKTLTYSAHDLAQLESQALGQGKTDWSKYVAVELPHRLPIRDTAGSGLRQPFGLDLARQMQLEILPPSGNHLDQVELYDTVEAQERHPAFRPPGRLMTRVRVEISNEDDLHDTMYGERAGPVGKDLHREQERWAGDRQPRLVTRDDHGEFATSGRGPEHAQARRRARRGKRRKQAELAAVQLRPVVTNDASLAELARIVRQAPPERELVAPPKTMVGSPLAELARQSKQTQAVPKGRAKAKPVPKAAPKAAPEKTEVGFAQNQAILMDLHDLDAVFDLHDLHWLDEDGQTTATRLPKEYAATDVDLRSGHVREALDAWVQTGSHTRQHGGGLSGAEMTVLANAVEQGAYDPIRRGGDPDQGRPPAYVRGELDRKTGKWGVFETTYHRPKLMLYGSPETVAALQSGDPDVEFKLESVAQDVHALAEHEGVSLNEGGPIPAALYAVKVSLVSGAGEGHRPTATRPPGGA